MPDITMCTNNKCTFRENCYRFKAKPKDYQSYAKFEQRKTFDGIVICNSYYPIEVK